MTDQKLMAQQAPWPTELEDLVEKCEYRPGWQVTLVDLDRGQESKGLTLRILTEGYDTYHPDRGQTYRVYHYFIVPAASYDRRSWQHWLLERFFDVERHEACEFFQIDGERPYAPHHGPGNDPYFVFLHGTDEDIHTSFRGEYKLSAEREESLRSQLASIVEDAKTSQRSTEGYVDAILHDALFKAGVKVSSD